MTSVIDARTVPARAVPAVTEISPPSGAHEPFHPLARVIVVRGEDAECLELAGAAIEVAEVFLLLAHDALHAVTKVRA